MPLTIKTIKVLDHIAEKSLHFHKMRITHLSFSLLRSSWLYVEVNIAWGMLPPPPEGNITQLRQELHHLPCQLTIVSAADGLGKVTSAGDGDSLFLRGKAKSRATRQGTVWKFRLRPPMATEVGLHL